MKKLLLLTSLLALSATAMAADTVAAPDAPVLNQFKPTGYWGQNLHATTNTFYNKDARQGDNVGTRTTQDSVMTLENEAAVSLTPKLQVYIDNTRDINYPTLNRDKGHSTTVRLNYNNGLIGDSQVNFKQRLQFATAGDKQDNYRYQIRFDFPSYLKADYANFLINFDHGRYDGQATPFKTSNAAKYDLDTGWTLGAGFSLEAELYGTAFGRSTEGHTDTDSSSATFAPGINYDLNLYNATVNTIDFHTELYGSATVGSSKVEKKDRHHTHSTGASSETYVHFKHNVNSATSVYLEPGVDLGTGFTKNGSKDVKKDHKRLNANAYLEVGFNVSF